MNDAIWNDLTAHISQAIESLPASLTRRQQMHEELLAHLCALYDEELQRLRDEQSAADRAKQRFGAPDHLRSELSAAVPWLERLVLLICGKGSIMWRWLWIVGLLGVFIGIGFVMPAVAQLRDPAPIMASDRFGIGVLFPFGVVVTLLGLCLFGYSMVRVFHTRNC
jgi:hypothetical protein